MKYDLPKDLYQQCLWIMRGYDRNKQSYLEARRGILDEGKAPNETGVRSTPTNNRLVEDIAARLAMLDQIPSYRQMHSVDLALDSAVEPFPPSMQQKLRKALFLSCQDGYKYTWEHLDAPGVSRSSFYRLRQRVLYEIAVNLSFIS